MIRFTIQSAYKGNDTPRNAEIILAWESAEARKNYLDSTDNQSARKIRKSDITSSISGRIEPFSGQRYVIDGRDLTDTPAGCLGRVVVGYEQDHVTALFN